MTIDATGFTTYEKLGTKGKPPIHSNYSNLIEKQNSNKTKKHSTWLETLSISG